MFPKISYSKAVYFAAIITVLAGVVVLIGWQLDNYQLQTFGFGEVTMKPNTAALFLLSGLTLLFLQFRHPIAKWFSRIFSSLIFLVGFLTLIQYLFKIDFGIDKLLFNVNDTTGFLPHPSRIAANTALNFVFLGIVLFYLSKYRNSINYFIEFCLVAAFSISLVGLLSFIFGFSDSAGATGYSRMAVSSAASFIILCFGVYFAIKQRYPNKITIEQKLFAGLTLSAIIIIFIFFLAFSNFETMHIAADKVKHTYIVKNKIEDVLTSIMDIETGSRGFVLSGNNHFLEPIEKMKLEIKEKIVGLRNFTKDNPPLQNNINKLEQLIIKKMEFADLKVKTRKLKGLTAAIVLINHERGQQLSDSIRDLKNNMIAEENQLLLQKEKKEDIRLKQTRTITKVSIIFQIFLLVIIFLFVSKDISGKRKVQSSLQILLEDLEEIVEERTANLKQSEEQVIKERDKANQYLDIAGVMLVLLNSSGKVSKINKKACEVLGYPENEIVGKDWFETVIPENIKDEIRMTFQAIMNSEIESMKFYENTIINKNGEERLIAWHNVLLLDEKGKLTGTLSSGEDITERKKAEELLYESQEHLTSAFENAAIGMALVAPNGDFTRVNSSLCNLVGYSVDELLTKSFREITHPDDLEKSNTFVNQMLAGEISTNQMEKRYFHKLGQVVWVLLSVSLVHDAQGKPLYFVAQIQNITESKQAENRKLQQTQILESIITGLPLLAILESIVKLVEVEDPTSLCSILLMDENGKNLLIGAAPSLPDFYNQAIDGVEIGEKVGSCGAAAYLKKRIIAEDLLIHPNWIPFRELTHQANLRSCWSEPILDAENNVLGTFAVYHRQPQAPQSEEIELLKSVVSLASLAISRKQHEEKIRNINTELELKVEERTNQLAATNENLQQEMKEHKKAEERIRLIVESAPNAIILVDAKGFIQLVNKQTENYFGYHRDELIGNKIEMLVPNASGMNHENLRSNFISHPTSRNMGVGRDLFGLKKDGTKFPIEVGLNPIHIQNETLILTNIIDITERRKNEIELIKFKTALDSSADDIFIIDYEKNLFIDANNTALKSLGYTKDELLQMAPNDIKPLISKDELKKIFDKIIHSQSKLDKIETVHRRKNGTDFEVEVFLRAFRFDNSDLLIASVRDITERKIAEEAIKNAKLEAERANIAKSEFLSRMSHELRTPLNSILGFTQLMSMGELNPAHQKGVDHIMKSGKHLLNLINEVLNLSRIEAGELSISLEPVEIKGIITETLDIIHPMAKEKSIFIELENHTKENIFIKADHQKLKQVLLNLVNNAVKFNYDKGLVKIRVKQQNEKIRIYIIDTGKGIAADEMPKLFNPFQRIGTEISIIEGTGLGLAVSKKLIEAMNGSIGVESEVGKGSTFWIELPAIEGQIVRHSKLEYLINSNNSTHIRGTILYIEDNISNQQLVKQIMDTQRPAVNLITNMYGKNTVDLALDYQPDVILLDLDLPDIHGTKVLKLLKENEQTKNIPVIVLSADATEKQIEKLLKAGAKAYLTKPIDVLEFLKVVDEYLIGNRK